MITPRPSARRPLNTTTIAPKRLAPLRTACAAMLAPLLLGLALPTLAQDQFMYSINPDSTITITKYLGSGGALAIPTMLGGLAVAVIGEDAFYGATSLTALTIPNTVTGIETNAFDYCTGLISLTLGDSVTNIEDGAFASCSSLTNLTIPSSVTTIGDGAFFSCSSLTAIYFQGNAPTVISGAFGNDNAATIYYLPGTTGWGPTLDGLPTVLLSLADPNQHRQRGCADQSIWLHHHRHLQYRRRGRGQREPGQSHLVSAANQHPHRRLRLFQRPPLAELPQPFLSPPLALRGQRAPPLAGIFRSPAQPEPKARGLMD